MTDLHTEYLGLSLRSPLVASAGPFTGDIDKLRELRDAGVAAVVLPSLFQEQIEHETSEIDRLYTMHQESFGEATSFMPELAGYTTGTDTYLSLIEAAKAALDIPVIASLNGANIGGWLRYARLLEDAGADAIELNLYAVSADPAIPGQDIEAEQLELVALLTDDVNVPVAVKISPFYTSVASFALGLQESGADGLVLFNRFYAPDLDLELLDVKPKISLSRPAELRLPLRWIGILHEFVDLSLAASTGVHSGHDAAKLLLAGADVTMMTSALLFNGASYVAEIEQELVEWMRHHEYRTVSEMRGAVSRDATADPSAYERANYIGNITSYSSRFLAGQPIRLQSR